MKINQNVHHSIIIMILIGSANFRHAYSACNDSEWECDNGQCIDEDNRCDGIIDCRDRSDEIAENCIHYHQTCQKFAFRCFYGACINGQARCNGVQDCADNSDELICTKKDDSDFQGRCNENEIQCVTTKECINSSYMCDGHVHCKDGSDESLPLCINFGCVSYGFQCGYGACIDTTARCNGTVECADGSDEAWELCDKPRKKNTIITKPIPTPTPDPTQYSRCLIPNILQTQDMIFKIHPLNETIAAGSLVDDFETIHIECKNRYTLRGQPSLLCQNGAWNYDFPFCHGFCDGTLLRGVSIRAVCDYRTRFVECPKKIRPGTEIQINCAFGYTRTPDNPQYIKCLPDGSFDKSPIRCKQNCGRISPFSIPLTKNGILIESSSAPWHVAIYENNSVIYDYICSGSIVSPRIIVTAAHCFWDEPTLTLRNYTEYQIIAGRSSSNYSTVQNEYSQIIDVEEIHIPFEYRGRNGRQRDDIAYVKLRTPLKYSETIASICIPNDLRNTASKYVVSNQKGFITGFGLRNQLERLKMITLAYHDCKDKSPPDAPVADDKFCIYNNEGGSVCRGDSGGGFFQELRTGDDNEIIYRLLGVISNTPTTKNDCTRTDDEAYVAITNIHYMASEFKNKLVNAIKDDVTLF